MNKNIYQLKEELPFLIMAHRGFWGGNIIENTRSASILASKAGAEIVEIDISVSADGEYYLFHSFSEKRLLGTDKQFHERSSAELDKTILMNSIGEPSGFYLEKLEDYLEWLPEDLFVNIDRSWFYWQDPHFFKVLNESGKADQFFLKSPAGEKWLDLLSDRGPSLPFVVLARQPADVENVINDYPEINLVGIELLPTKAEDLILSSDWLDKMRKNNILLLVNSINLGMNPNLFLSTDDNIAFLEGVADSWDRILTFKPDIIQTDWPNFLSEYRDKIK